MKEKVLKLKGDDLKGKGTILALSIMYSQHKDAKHFELDRVFVENVLKEYTALSFNNGSIR